MMPCSASGGPPKIWGRYEATRQQTIFIRSASNYFVACRCFKHAGRSTRCKTRVLIPHSHLMYSPDRHWSFARDAEIYFRNEPHNTILRMEVWITQIMATKIAEPFETVRDLTATCKLEKVYHECTGGRSRHQSVARFDTEYERTNRQARSLAIPETCKGNA
jgi:hypothetical protein